MFSMSEIAANPTNIDFRIATNLGVNDPLLRGAVKLQRADASLGAGRDFEGDARHLSSLLMRGAALIATVDASKAWQPPIASVISTTHRTFGKIRRHSLELTSLAVDDNFSDRGLLASTVIALSCQGRNRFRPVAINVNYEDEAIAESLDMLGFEKDEALSGVEIYTGIPPQDHYTIAAGQLAIRGANRSPDSKELFRQARQSLS